MRGALAVAPFGAAPPHPANNARATIASEFVFMRGQRRGERAPYSGGSTGRVPAPELVGKTRELGGNVGSKEELPPPCVGPASLAVQRVCLAPEPRGFIAADLAQEKQQDDFCPLAAEPALELEVVEEWGEALEGL